MADDLAENVEIPAAAAAEIAIGDHPDDAEIAASDSAILEQATRTDYNKRMTAMEEYFRQKKAAAMFAAGHKYEGRVDVTKITAHDFKRFLMSDKRTVDGALERKRYGVLTKYRAALGHYYTDQGQVLAKTAFYAEICKYLRGVSSEDAKKKAKGVIDDHAKRALPRKLYERSGADMLTCTGAATKPKPAIFGSFFSKLLWNLSCRSDNIAGKSSGVCVTHMALAGDAITVKYYRSKKDPTGVKNANAKHCYANPLQPEICLNTAAGVYFLCNQELEGLMVFPGNHQAGHFSDVVCEYFAQEEAKLVLQECGIPNDKLGVHSWRKGVLTDVSTGSTMSPSPDAVGRRAMWGQDDVRSRYIEFGKAGDTFVGRYMAGLPINSADFSVLPPHFAGNAEEMQFVAKCVSELFPGHVNKCAAMPALLRRFLASVVYHLRPEGYLTENMAENHPLRSTLLCTSADMLPKLQLLVELGRTKNEKSGMMATGIPPHVEMFVRVEAMETSLAAMPRRRCRRRQLRWYPPPEQQNALLARSLLWPAVTF